MKEFTLNATFTQYIRIVGAEGYKYTATTGGTVLFTGSGIEFHSSFDEEDAIGALKDHILKQLAVTPIKNQGDAVAVLSQSPDKVFQ